LLPSPFDFSVPQSGDCDDEGHVRSLGVKWSEFSANRIIGFIWVFCRSLALALIVSFAVGFSDGDNVEFIVFDRVG
jgi:hypothetical protein